HHITREPWSRSSARRCVAPGSRLTGEREIVMKLFYSPGACSIGIHVLLEEIGKPYQTELVNLREGAQFKPEFTSVNPKSKVPTVARDDGSILTEYPAIAYWLARTNPEKKLLPDDVESQTR